MAKGKHTPGPGPWAREYACGCREVLNPGTETVASDRCDEHGEKVVVVGYLTPQAVTDDVVEALEFFFYDSPWTEAGGQGLCLGCGYLNESGHHAADCRWVKGRDALARARGEA